MITTIIGILVLLLIVGYFTRNQIAVKLVNLFNSKANTAIDNMTDKSDLLVLKVKDLEIKRKDIIKSIAKMKANELRNEANITEITTLLSDYNELALKYKQEEKKDDCIKVLTRIHIKQNELDTLTKINNELKVYIIEGEKQLEVFKNKIIGLQSKVSIIQNKKTNAEALSELSGLNEADDNVDELINNANIEYDTTKIASETLLQENDIDFDLNKLNTEEAYAKL